MHAVEEETVKRFVNDVQRCDEQKRRLDECGEIFELAVAVGMPFVGWFIRDAHGEKGDDRREQVEAGVQCLGEYAQASRAENEKSLQRNQQHGRANAQQCRPALLARFFILPSCRHCLTRLP